MISRPAERAFKAVFDATNLPSFNSNNANSGGGQFVIPALIKSVKLMTLKDSIAMYESLGVMHTPEIKWTVVDLPYKNLTRNGLVQKVVDPYKPHGVDPDRVYLQSFFKEDILYLVANESEFAANAVFLNSMDNMTQAPTAANFTDFIKADITTWSPPLFALLELKDGKLVASKTALEAGQSLGLGLN